MNLNTIIRIKLQTQLKVNDKLIAAALGSCLKISPTTINGIGPEKYRALLLKMFITWNFR
jgi:hypothetical protein